MSKKIISIILTIALILCQGTLCLGTVSAADSFYIVDPVGYDITVDAGDWAPSNASISNNDEGDLVFTSDGYKNNNKERYDSGWMELKNLSIDVRNYCAIEITAFVDNAKPLTYFDGTDWTQGNNTRPQIYYSGKKADGSEIRVSEGNSTSDKFGQYNVSGDKNNGFYSENFETYVWETSGAWLEMSELNMLRFDVLKNSSGTVRIKSIRLIEKPGIESIGYNSAYEADINAMPVDPDSIDIGIAGPMYSVDGSVTITDAEGNEVEIAKTAVVAGKAILTLAPGTELAEFTEYTVTFDENTMVTQNKNLHEPIVFTFTTDDSKAPSIFDAIDPERPSDYTDDNVIWSAEFKTDSDANVIPSSGGIRTEIAYGEYLQYTSPLPTINSNGNVSGSYADTVFSPAIDANVANRLQIRMKVVSAEYDGTISGKKSDGETVTKSLVPPHLQLYFAGVNDDGSTFSMNGSHSYSDESMYKMHEDENGNMCTDWFIYDINLNSIKSWVDASEINRFRFDVMNNCKGVALIDYIRFIGPKMPEIEKIGYNSMADVDEAQGLPVNADTVDLYLTEMIYSVDASGVIFEDEYGNNVAVETVSLANEGKLVSIKLAQELDENTLYFIGLNENTKLGSQMNLTEAVVAECSTGTYRAPTIFDIIDPERPDDTIPEGAVVRSLDFRDSSDLTYFKSSANLKTEIKYGEYMEYSTSSLFTGASGGLASYYVDSDFRNDKIDSDKFYRLQIRLKVVEQVMQGGNNGYFKMYFKGNNSVGMSENNMPGGIQYTYRTDSEGKLYTDWMILDIDLSQYANWVKASEIETMRFDIMHNAAGTLLVDYIRFIALPAATEVSYTDAQGTTVIEDGVYVPENASSINVKLSAPLMSKVKVSLENEFGSVANVDAANVKYDAKTSILTIPLKDKLEKSSTYNVKIESSTDFGSDLQTTQTLYTPVETSFKTELDPVNATIEVGENTANITYTNASSSDVVLVGIATGWDGNKYMGKEMTITEVAAGTTVSDVVLGFNSIKDYNVEFVVWQYDIATSTYTVLSKSITNN